MIYSNFLNKPLFWGLLADHQILPVQLTVKSIILQTRLTLIIFAAVSRIYKGFSALGLERKSMVKTLES